MSPFEWLRGISGAPTRRRYSEFRAPQRRKHLTDHRLRTHVDNWNKETARHGDNLQDFLSWFDPARSPEESHKAGYWDFSYHILKPVLLPLLGEPFEKRALEIGYGAGRLLVPACHFFRQCIGIDVHQYGARVSKLIKEHGVDNFALQQTNGNTIPLAGQSVDFAYSFIVLQHLPTIGSLNDYLGEIYRVLRRGAVAILYMGFLPGRLRSGYVDLSTNQTNTVRNQTLRLTILQARRMLRDVGFRVVSTQRSMKKPWLLRSGGQFYVVVERPG